MYALAKFQNAHPKIAVYGEPVLFNNSPRRGVWLIFLRPLGSAQGGGPGLCLRLAASRHRQRWSCF